MYTYNTVLCVKEAEYTKYTNYNRAAKKERIE